MTLGNGERVIRFDGHRFHVEDHGDGDPILLLHGWPDSSHLWRHQIPVLAEAGFRAVAPDLLGFGRSERPAEVGAYALSRLLSSVIGILDALDLEWAHVVGHDWGAALAWELAIHHPERVGRVVVMSVPHPTVPLDLGQREKGWYRLFFLLEGVAEAWLRHDDWALFRELLRGEGDIDRYRADLGRPGALTASLNWYRANLVPTLPEPTPELHPVRAPVLAIWPERDHFLSEQRLLASEKFVEGGWRYVRIEGAGHWLPLHAPDDLSGLLLEWLTP